MQAGTQTILMATDLSARSDRPMERALLLAKQMRASLLVLHVLAKPLSADEEGEIREQLGHEFDLAGADAEILFAHGSIPAVIAGVADKRDCTLIVTGLARFNSPKDYLLGTTVDYLVRQSPVPVLVVKRRARDPYDRLLIATDFSDCSAFAARAAGRLFPEAELRLVHSYHAAFEGFLERESTVDHIRQESERSMKRFVESLPEEVRRRLTTACDEGELGAVIADEVGDWSADLLVIGSHGHSGLAHATLGDTAADLLKWAECDVLLTRGRGADGASEG